MEMDYTFTMSLAFGSLTAISLIGAHVFYSVQSTQLSSVIKLFYPILFTVFGLLMFSSLHNVQGYPVKMSIPDGWVYHNHIESGDWINVVMENDKSQGEYRFFSIPRSLDNSEKLNELGEEARKGLKMQLYMDGDYIKGYEILNPMVFIPKAPE